MATPRAGWQPAALTFTGVGLSLPLGRPVRRLAAVARALAARSPRSSGTATTARSALAWAHRLPGAVRGRVRLERDGAPGGARRRCCEYLPFVIILLSRSTPIAGGIGRARHAGTARPTLNTGLLALGALLASIMGTTGARDAADPPAAARERGARSEGAHRACSSSSSSATSAAR